MNCLICIVILHQSLENGRWTVCKCVNLYSLLFVLNIFSINICNILYNEDVHKVFVDCEGHETAHGRAYEKFGIDINKGAVIIVRPDHCKFAWWTKALYHSDFISLLDKKVVSAVFGIEDQKKVSEFFSTILLQSLDTQNYKKNRFLPNWWAKLFLLYFDPIVIFYFRVCNI